MNYVTFDPLPSASPLCYTVDKSLIEVRTKWRLGL